VVFGVFLPDSELSSPELIIVHTREIIMDKRECMHDLESDTELHYIVIMMYIAETLSREREIELESKYCPKSLSSLSTIYNYLLKIFERSRHRDFKIAF
jgi:hypothetical protein